MWQATCDTMFVEECLNLCRAMWRMAVAQPCSFREAHLGFLREQLLRDDRDKAPEPKGLRKRGCGKGKAAAKDGLTANIEEAVQAGVLDGAAPAATLDRS